MKARTYDDETQEAWEDYCNLLENIEQREQAKLERLNQGEEYVAEKIRTLAEVRRWHTTWRAERDATKRRRVI